MQYYGRFEGNLICRDIIDEFKSSFWHEKNWNFSHQHIWFEHLNNGFFYSTKPYRRNEFILYEEVNQEICPQLEENFNSVKHVYIANKTTTLNYSHYFPNANTLTIEGGVEMALLLKRINCIVPIQKVMKLFIKEFAITIRELVRILDAACNLNIVELNFLNVDDTETNEIMTGKAYQSILKNKVQTLIIHNNATSKTMEFIVILFPTIECIKIGIKAKEIIPTCEYVLSEKHHNMPYLVLLCIFECTTYVKELTVKLLNDYLIKIVNRDMYVWW